MQRTRRARTSRFACFSFAGLAVAGLLLAGCVFRPRGNVELLEGRLRQQQDALAHTQQELEQARSELEIAQRESQALRQQISARGESPILPEQANVLFRASGVHFHKLLTGGLNEDQQPGDELLSALLIPHDADGESLKLPGTISLELFDMARPKGEQLIGEWNFDLAESQEHWYRGFIGSGFLFRLPWQQSPENSELLLHGRLTTTDGRQFDASQQIQISLQPATKQLTLTEYGPEAPNPFDSAPVLEPLPVPDPKQAGPTAQAPDRPKPPFEIARPAPRSTLAEDPTLVPPPRDPPLLGVPNAAAPTTKKSVPLEEDSAPVIRARRPVPRAPVYTSDKWTDGTIPRLR